MSHQEGGRTRGRYSNVSSNVNKDIFNPRSHNERNGLCLKGGRGDAKNMDTRVHKRDMYVIVTRGNDRGMEKDTINLTCRKNLDPRTKGNRASEGRRRKR